MHSTASTSAKKKGGFFSRSKPAAKSAPPASTSPKAAKIPDTGGDPEKKPSDGNELDRLRAELAQLQLKNVQLEEAVKKADFQVYDLKSKLENNNQLLHGVDPLRNNALSIVGEERGSQSVANDSEAQARSPSILAVSGRRSAHMQALNLDPSPSNSASKERGSGLEMTGPSGNKPRPSLFKQQSTRRQSGLAFMRRGNTDDVGNRSIAKMLDEHLQKKVENGKRPSETAAPAIPPNKMPEEPTLSAKLSSSNLTKLARSASAGSEDSVERRGSNNNTKKGQNRSASFLRKMLAH